MANNLGKFLDTMADPAADDTRSLTALREQLIKTRTWLVRHARYTVFQFGEAPPPRAVLGCILDVSNSLRRPPVETACTPGVSAARLSTGNSVEAD